MSPRTLAVAAGAVALFLVAVFGVMALTGGSGSTPPVMTMTDGSTMPADQMGAGTGTESGAGAGQTGMGQTGMGQTGMDQGMTGMDMSTAP